MMGLQSSEVKVHKLLCNYAVKTGHKDCGEKTKKKSQLTLIDMLSVCTYISDTFNIPSIFHLLPSR